MQTNPPAVAVKPHIMPDKWMRALGTIHALAYSATDFDRIMLTVLCKLDIVRIDKITRMVDFTAKSNREFGRVLAGWRPVMRHRSGNGKESLTIGQLGSLQQQLFRRAEYFVYVPAGTGAAVFGELHAAGHQPFGNIASIVNAQKEKRNAARIGAFRLVKRWQTCSKLAPNLRPSRPRS